MSEVHRKCNCIIHLSYRGQIALPALPHFLERQGRDLIKSDVGSAWQMQLHNSIGEKKQFNYLLQKSKLSIRRYRLYFCWHRLKSVYGLRSSSQSIERPINFNGVNLIDLISQSNELNHQKGAGCNVNKVLVSHF